MGCCASTPSDPSPQANPNASTRAINTSQPTTQPMIPTRPSTNESSNTATQRHQHRDLTKHPTRGLKPHIWASQKRTWTRAQIDQEREAFFDTRTSGRPEIWGAIRSALEVLWSGGDMDENDGGMATAQSILSAAGVTIPNGELTGAVYDSFGALYPLPEYIVCDPTNLVELPTRGGDEEGDKSEIEGESADEAVLLKRREEKGKGVLNPNDLIDVKVKLSCREDQPLKVTISKEDSVRIVTKKIYDGSGLAPPKHIRIAYMGKILKETQTLKAQGWQEDHVLNGLVLG